MAVAANAILNVILISFFKMIHWHAEHMALGIASSGSAFVNAGMLYYYLHKRNIYRFGAHWKKIFAQYGFANLCMAGALAYGLHLYDGHLSTWMKIVELTALCVVGAAAYTIGLLLSGFRPRHLRPEH